jgi:hypothetical protein
MTYIPLRQKRWGLLPLDEFELHPDDRCAFCGDPGRARKLSIILSTNAVGYRCLDVVACERRRTALKKDAA